MFYFLQKYAKVNALLQHVYACIYNILIKLCICIYTSVIDEQMNINDQNNYSNNRNNSDSNNNSSNKLYSYTMTMSERRLLFGYVNNIGDFVRLGYTDLHEFYPKVYAHMFMYAYMFIYMYIRMFIRCVCTFVLQLKHVAKCAYPSKISTYMLCIM